MSRHVGFGVESSYASLATITDFSEAISESVQKEETYEDLKTVRANAVLQVNQLTSKIGGDVELAGNYQDHGVPLKYFFGANITSGAGPYTHAITVGSRAGLSVSMEIQRDTAALTSRYTGCKFVGWNFSGGLNQSPRSRFAVVGKAEATGTATSASFPTFDPMVIGDTSVEFDDTALDVQGFNLNCAWPVNEPFKIGTSQYAVEPTDQTLLVEGDVTVLLSDLTEYAKYDGSTDVKVEIICDDGTHSLTITLTTSRLVGVPWNITERDLLLATFNFRAFDESAITVDLVNDDAVLP